MNLIYKQAEDKHKEFIFDECIKLVKKYESFKFYSLDEIVMFESKKIDKYIGEYTVVYDNDTFIGCFKLTEDEDGYELDDLYIVEELRNKGYGTKILEECIKKTPLTLYVFKNNKIAYDLYQRYGFEVIEDLEDRVKMKRV